MSAVARRIWREPAVFLGLIVTLALLIVALATDQDWDAATIALVLAPLATALGIRPLVMPTRTPPPKTTPVPPPRTPPPSHL